MKPTTLSFLLLFLSLHIAGGLTRTASAQPSNQSMLDTLFCSSDPIEATGYDSHVELRWRPVSEADRYAVYRLGTSRDTILRGTTNRTYYLDFVETTDTTYTYRVVALDPSGKALYTTPDVSASVQRFTDDQLQEMVQRYTFRYFWEFADPLTGLAFERSNDSHESCITIGGSVSPAGGNFEEPVTQATLKVVGAFLGLSRERSSARRFPAIHPLDSWSKYKSIVEPEKLAYARHILRRGNEVNQMMKVVGEEGTHIDDFVIYLKSEFIDFVYLQQNTFDKVDGATSRERQVYMFDKVTDVLKSTFKFEDKEVARRYFLELRLAFTHLNYAEFQSDKFRELEKVLDAKISERKENA